MVSNQKFPAIMEQMRMVDKMEPKLMLLGLGDEAGLALVVVDDDEIWSHPIGRKIHQTLLATKLKRTALFMHKAIPTCNCQIIPTANLTRPAQPK